MELKKKIGIIGGVGPQATNYLYTKIIEYSQLKYGAKNNDDYPNLLIESVPIPDFISDIKNINRAKIQLIESVKTLTNTGATCLALGSNTVHLLLNELKQATEIPFISIIGSVANEVQKQKIKKVGILGSSTSLKFKIYDGIFRSKSIGIVKPTKQEQKIIDSIIRYVLAGEDNGKERKQYIQILHSILEKGAEGIILGCTELPSAINYEALGSKIIDSMAVLAEKLTDYYYTNQ